MSRSFSINGLRLTNVKTSFAVGFDLHHWSILEGELIVILQFFYFSATILQISTIVIMAFSIAWIETYS